MAKTKVAAVGNLLLILVLIAMALGEPGKTTRYWDCCKVSCGWSANVAGGKNVNSCAKNGASIADKNAQSGCNRGPSYACNNNQPITINANLAYVLLLSAGLIRAVSATN